MQDERVTRAVELFQEAWMLLFEPNLPAPAPA
jgi:hypothetical protein